MRQFISGKRIWKFVEINFSLQRFLINLIYKQSKYNLMRLNKILLGLAILLSVVALNSGCKKSTEPGGGTPEPKKCENFTDARDGKAYTVIQIGEQCWMAENLDYDPGTGAYCYKEKVKLCDSLGSLYDLASAKTACPDGWHLPTEAEWQTLITNVGGKATAGKELIDGGPSGFNAKYAGVRSFNGLYSQLSTDTYFWTTTEVNTGTHAWVMALSKNIDQIIPLQEVIQNGYSCRCVMDK
jgi:uncharacterized protein (TIGR02145 family)